MTPGRTCFQHEFPAMGSTVEMLLVGDGIAASERAFRQAERLAEEWEWTFSRFRPDSELSRLNARAGAPVRVSERLFSAIEISVAAAQITRGLFDPSVLPSLVSLGYDRPFVEINTAAMRAVSSLPHRAPGVARLGLHAGRNEVTLPAGTAIDLGGIAKGFFADCLASQLAAWPGGMVSAGGDLRLWGQPPEGEHWLVGIEDPDQIERDVATLALDGGGVATSGTNRRHWRSAGGECHHIVDPRTGLSADSGMRSITVMSSAATLAEVVSTALFVAGADPDSIDLVRPLFSVAIVVTVDRQIREIYGTEYSAYRAAAAAVAG